MNGPFYACRKVVPLMTQQGGGKIINTASVGGIRGGNSSLSAVGADQPEFAVIGPGAVSF